MSRSDWLTVTVWRQVASDQLCYHLAIETVVQRLKVLRIQSLDNQMAIIYQMEQ